MVEYCKFCGKDIKDLKPTQKGQHVANCSMNPNIKIIKDKRALSKIETQRAKNPILKIKLRCLNCNEEFEIDVIESYYKRGRYKKCCCEKCAKQYSTKNYDDDILKKDFCKECGEEFLVKNRTKIGISTCTKCRKLKRNRGKNIKNINKKLGDKNIIEKILVCKFCGDEKCKKPEVCSKFRQKNNVYEKYLGFDSSKKGNNDVYTEFDRIINELKFDYFDKELSIVEISKKYNMNYKSMYLIFKKNNIVIRTFSEAVMNSIKNGKINYNNIVQYPYKSGMYITWKGDNVHYRSNYEKEYYSILDDKKVNYEVESLRIQYYDTQKKKIRIAIPDIYIKEINEIIEIKSKWTLNEINMKDKVKSYKKLGYNVRLIVGEGNKNFFKNTIDIIY